MKGIGNIILFCEMNNLHDKFIKERLLVLCQDKELNKMGLFFQISSLKNTRRSYCYACVFCLDL
jgi:hypothetical protein